MARIEGKERIYEVAELFRQRCLVQQTSLLWPDREVWTVENLDRYWSVVPEHPDETGRNFFEKLNDQLADQLDVLHKIAADLMVIYSLSPTNIGAPRKLEYIDIIRAWKSLPDPEPHIHALLNDAFTDGIAHTGTGYLTSMPFQTYLYLHFSREVIRNSVDPYDVQVTRRVADEAVDFIRKNPNTRRTTSSARHLLLHMLFPDYFEDTASQEYKWRTLNAFREQAGVAPDEDLDDGLLAVRKHLEAHFGKGFSFYQPEVRRLWDLSGDKDGSIPDPAEIETPIEHSSSNGAEYEDLAAIVQLREDFLIELNDLLSTKRQLIFEGPPGSGKTYVAEKFARWFTGQALDGEPLNKQVEIVQLHQSYGYEDFVQGIRPETNDDGQLVYRVWDGIFLDMCERAKANPEERFVLIIDEINRGNLSRIFGELLLLLEYRNQSVRLPYGSGDSAYLTIPENLYLIGTMNTADRSLAQIDYALRRRFYFVRFMPVEDGKAEVFATWLAANDDIGEGEKGRLLRLFINLNEGIREHLHTDDLQVGHSYFMQPGIQTPVVFERVWRRAVRPLLEEYLHHHRNRDDILAALTPDALLDIPVTPPEQSAGQVPDDITLAP
ncbi:MAG TPA: AAA family ATPase [Thermomicrobiales bacterium]|nr:AAA family ATPase [Thermomicrobiales bacterium]